MTLVIDRVKDKLVGTIVPFFGGRDGASFTDADVAGDELHTIAVIGPLQPPGAEPRAPSDWRSRVRIRLDLTQEGMTLRGRAEVSMDGARWIAYQYELSRKRPRYGP